jgi:hypothetical protein
MKFKHKISPNSPLNLNPDKGYTLLKEIEAIPKKGILPIELPPEADFYVWRSYSSDFMTGSKNLAQILMVDRSSEEEVLPRAWSAVLGAAEDLYHVSRIIDPSSSPKWISVEVQSKKYVAESGIIHCDLCDTFLRDNLVMSSNGKEFANEVLLTWCHGDLHPGNLIFTESAAYVVDLENLHPAPLYSDLIIFSLLCQGATQYLIDSFFKFAGSHGTPTDITQSLLHALRIGVLQLKNASPIAAENIKKNIHNVISLTQDYRNQK